MTDVTSEKLYEKLDRINNVKRNLKRVMTDIGGYEFFQNDPKFETYPEILCQIQDRIEVIKRLLDVSVYGKEINTVMTTADTTYNKIVPYLNEIQSCRSSLIDNLNTKGVTADTDETLRSLVDKVLDIEGGGDERVPFEETLLSINIGVFNVDLVHIGSYSSTSWYEELTLRFYNTSDSDVSMEEPLYYVKVSNNDFTKTYSTVCHTQYPIYSHETYTFYLLGAWDESSISELKEFVDSIKSNGGHITYSAHYASQNRRDVIPIGDIGTINYLLVRLDERTYYIHYTGSTPSGSPTEIVTNSYDFCMRDGDVSYSFAHWSPGSYFYVGGSYNTISIWNDSMLELFYNYLTNTIEVETINS